MSNQGFKKTGYEALSMAQNRSIESVDLKNFQTKKDYFEIKKKYGSLAETDQIEKNQNQKAFHLNDVVKESLKIEIEENRAIQEKVREKLKEVEAVEKEKGYQQGYEDGFLKGFKEAEQEWKKEAVKRMEKLEFLMGQFEEAVPEIFKTQEVFLMKLLSQVVKKVILKELNEDQQYPFRMIQELIKKVGFKENLKINISQDQAHLIDSINENLLNHFKNLKNISLEVSNTLPEKGFRIETDWNHLETDLKFQLEALESIFLLGNKF